MQWRGIDWHGDGLAALGIDWHGDGDDWHGAAGAKFSTAMRRHCTALNRMGNDRRVSALAMNGVAMLGHCVA